jgi:hypothetical protein
MMKQDGKRRWLAAVCICAVAAGALIVRGDIATPRPRWSEVRMESEEVNIKLGKKKVYVEALFNMHNTGSGSKVRFGYPLGLFEKELNDFKVYVEDKEIDGVGTEKTEEKKNSPRPVYGRGRGGKQNVQSEPYRFSGPYKEWKVFNVPFKADEKKKIKVSYWVEPAVIDNTSHGKLNFYAYTLVTGATWKDTIKKAVINVKLDGVAAGDILQALPGDSEQKGSTISWTMKDFKPDKNIEIVYKP